MISITPSVSNSMGTEANRAGFYGQLHRANVKRAAYWSHPEMLQFL